MKIMYLTHRAIIALQAKHSEITYRYNVEGENFRTVMSDDIWRRLVEQRQACESDSALVFRLCSR
jgi:hypothetical protein